MTRKATKFGQNVKILRKNKGHNQAFLGEKLGLERTSVSNYENSISEPPLYLVVKIANFFQISLDVLLTHDLSKETSVTEYLRTSGVQVQEPSQLYGREREVEVNQLKDANKHLQEKVAILEDYIGTLKQLTSKQKDA